MFMIKATAGYIFASPFAWIRTLDIRMNDSALFHCATTTGKFKKKKTD
jgi:hypothetical protein